MEDYDFIIKKISKTYGDVGYSRLWEVVLPELQTAAPHRIDIARVVVDKFLTESNGSASSRIWGFFSDERKAYLVKTCKEEERRALTDKDERGGVDAIARLPPRCFSKVVL